MQTLVKQLQCMLEFPDWTSRLNEIQDNKRTRRFTLVFELYAECGHSERLLLRYQDLNFLLPDLQQLERLQVQVTRVAALL